MAVPIRAPSLSVIVTGCHSGPNPSPGLGVARSLRLAYPDAYLVGKDHSLHSSGLHDPLFDEVWICVPWNEMDLHGHREQVRARLEPGVWLISTQDLEARWLAEAPPSRALIPELGALDLTAKPSILAAQNLPVRVPEWAPFTLPDRDLYGFCRAHNWRVWVKGPAYEARAVRSWTELARQKRELADVWGEAGLFVQADVEGWEVSIAFAAYQGQLLDAVFMEKRLVTEIGKTWAGEISEAPSTLIEPLKAVVAELRWTGGGELEFVRDRAGELWLIDWNPRFPAWIFGATLAGRNLPAQLLAAASGVAPRAPEVLARQFTRVVTEVPVRAGLALPPPPPAKRELEPAGKNPTGMPLLMRRMAQQADAAGVGGLGPHLASTATTPAAVELPEILVADLREATSSDQRTPHRTLLPRTVESRFQRVASLARPAGSGSLPLRIAYSVKTNPSPELLSLARTNGFLAEVISAREVRSALQAGFRLDEIIYNGPIPLNGEIGLEGELQATFADSPGALQRYANHQPARVVGLRIRPPLVSSRFGIQLEEPKEFAAVVDILAAMPKDVPFGVSIHVQSSEVGLPRWLTLARSALHFGAALQELTARPIELLDLGGGWAAEDLEPALLEDLPRLLDQAKKLLPNLKLAVIEPGKALVEPCAAVVCRVVEVRQRWDGTREIVVDGSIAEVPLVQAFPHRLVALSGDRVECLTAGADRVLGRLCMENDVLGSDVRLPAWLAPGDFLCVCDAGAYDSSMAYRFGRGNLEEDEP